MQKTSRRQDAQRVLFTAIVSLCVNGACYASTLQLTDVTSAAGIDFLHVNGATPPDAAKEQRYMPETMGSGVAVLDYDGDGDQDLFFVNSTYFDASKATTVVPALYENLGDWQFKDVTQQAGLAKAFYGMGATAADYNGDGYMDILVTGLNAIRLYRNRGDGQFDDVTHSSGLRPAHWRNHKHQHGIEWSTAAVLFDADGDDDLDIVTAQYVKWSIEADIHTTYDALHKGYTSPKAYEGQTLRLWQQNQGRFRDATVGSGLELEGKGLGLALWDFDNDQRLDIVVANDTSANFLFHNRGQGHFVNIAENSGIAYDKDGNTRAGMGIDIADYLNNGSVGIAIGNFSGEPTSLFHMHEPMRFTEDSSVAGLAPLTLAKLTFGLVFADLDLDGWQDILTVNGHVEPYIASVVPHITYAQPLQWLRNLGNGRFSEAGKQSKALQTPMVGRGLAVADLDNDGDLDIVATANDGIPRLIRNDSPHRRYLKIKLHGLAPNTDAIGALIVLHGTRITQRRLVKTGSSYLSQSELTQTFGLPPDETIKAVEITWPNGQRERINTPAVNQTLHIKQARN